MSFGTTMVTIVLIVMIARVLRSRYESQGRGRRDFLPDTNTQELERDVRVLKERIAVLERLATDENTTAQLDREIEKLRDRS